MRIEFKTKNEKQLEAAEYWIDSITEEMLYGGAKGGGKSYLGASLIFGDAFIYPETHYFIARKELIDLRKYTIPTIEEVVHNFGLSIEKYAKYNGQDNCYTLYNKSKVFLIACKEEPSDPMFERFGSMQMTRGWIEEGGEIAENAKSNLWLSIGRWKNELYGLKKKLLITANPKKGWMKKDFVVPHSKGLLQPSKKYIQAFATDNPYLPADYIKSLREEKNKVRRQRLWEGDWDYDEEKDSLISFDALTDTFSNTITKDGGKYLTVDVARLGRDKTVFSFWNGLELYRVEEYQRQGTDKTIQQLKDYASSEQIPYSNILVDEDGIGGAVVDHLFGVKGFTANSTPIPTATQVKEMKRKVDHFLVPKTSFKNLKSQCGWKLAELINERSISFQVPEQRGVIIEELTSQLRDKEVDGEGKKQLLPKDKVKEELGHSPDLGDTILMRAFFELRKEATGEDDQTTNRVRDTQADIWSRNKRNLRANSSK